MPRDGRRSTSAPEAGTARSGSRARRRAPNRVRGTLALVALAGTATAVLAALLGPTAAERLDPEPRAPRAIQVAPDDTSATATWAADSDTTYRVQYSDEMSLEDARTTDVKDRRVALESLAPGTTYFLRIKAIRDGKESAPSRLVRFTTDFPYQAPRLVVGSRTSTSLSARWSSDAEKPARYELQVDSDESFDSPRSRTVSTRKARIGNLKYRPSYSVRVRVVGADGTALSPWSEADRRKTSRQAPLRVGSFNVLKSARNNWSARRIAVAETIRSQDMDVVGLQEATPASVAGGLRQYADVVRALGPGWALTEDSTGPTGEVRTVYNTDRVRLVDHGWQEIPGSTRFGVMRYITWAIFEQKSTGKEFVFLNTHFITSKARSRFGPRAAAAAQMAQVARTVSKDGELPVVIAGDFNSAALRNGSNGVYRALTGAGYLDPLVPGQELGSAERTINADLKTVNKYARVPRRDASAPMIDHMFVSPMRVKEWETVAKLDGRGRVIGTIPSDHHMIRLTVFLP